MSVDASSFKRPRPRRWFYGQCEQCLLRRDVTIVSDSRRGRRAENDLTLCRRCFRG